MNKPVATNSRLVWLLPAIITGALGAYWLRREATPPEKVTTEIVEPGVTLTAIERDGAQPLHMFVVRTDFTRGWRLRVVASDGSVTGQYFGSGAGVKRTTVSHMLATHNRIYKSDAPVAVNGGFFAYEGAAVGAVKLNNQWLRLPWKNRTAIGFASDGKAKIANLQGTARLNFGDGSIMSINGLNSHPARNAVTVLTPHFAENYKLKTDEIALFIDKGEIHSLKNSGAVSISPEGFLVVANGSARAAIEKIPLSSIRRRIAGEKFVTATSVRLEVVTTPGEWQNYPTILGAGPRLVRNGQVHTTEVEEEFRPDVTRRGPRTAIGIDKAGNYFLVVVEGGLEYSGGLTLPELGREMQALGAVDAINLDGGASVALVVKDTIITPKGPEVPVANAVLVVREKPDKP